MERTGKNDHLLTVLVADVETVEALFEQQFGQPHFIVSGGVALVHAKLSIDQVEIGDPLVINEGVEIEPRKIEGGRSALDALGSGALARLGRSAAIFASWVA